MALTTWWRRFVEWFTNPTLPTEVSRNADESLEFERQKGRSKPAGSS